MADGIGPSGTVTGPDEADLDVFGPLAGLPARLGAVYDAIRAVRAQEKRSERLSPVWNRPFKAAVAADRALEARGGKRTPRLTPEMSRSDSVRAYQDQYRTSPELAKGVYDASRRHGIEPSVGFGVVDVESGFRQRLTSPAGAKGLMQVRPIVAEELGMPPEALDEPLMNLEAGMGYLARLKAHYGLTEPERMLDAYHRGPTAAKRAPRGEYARKVLGKASRRPK